MNFYLPQKAARLYKAFFVCFLLSFLGACASTPNNANVDPDNPDIQAQVKEKNVDSLEGFNRVMFRFNDTFDYWLLKPIARGYNWITPSPVKTGVGNFFSNLGEIRNIVNDGLQWKWKQASNDTGRFLLNSTIGLVGLIDVASAAGLEKSDGENFSQTLAKWGVGRGSYLVLPFLGPTTVRGGLSMPADWVTDPTFYLESSNATIALSALNIIHTRSELLKAEDLISGDRYLFIREAYLQRLDFLENDGVVEDDFGDGEDFGDDEYDDYE
ncbi:MlaA family lipoprotein [Agarilytica rhodophyticola]|uniref:MlaA family lipoprotein n=1 Tax=Agarilytica rhodophyticola TaxID=1737490 RepID=UPI001FE5F70E|nr:VacJ family lipoprotein [Agarilytica rhodophyticola]